MLNVTRCPSALPLAVFSTAAVASLWTDAMTNQKKDYSGVFQHDSCKTMDQDAVHKLLNEFHTTHGWKYFTYGHNMSYI
jgi:hypothetical protein